MVQKHRWTSPEIIRRLNNLYPTPAGACEILAPLALQSIAKQEGLRVLDIGSGFGHWGAVIRHLCPDAHITALEVDQTLPESPAYDEIIYQDFGYFTTPGKFDLIIGNPPYIKMLPQWVLKCRSLLANGGVLGWLLRTEFMGGNGRHKEVFANYPPMLIYQIVGRLSFVYPESTAKSNYDNAFFIWSDKPAEYTRLHWIKDKRMNNWNFSFE